MSHPSASVSTDQPRLPGDCRWRRLAWVASPATAGGALGRAPRRVRRARRGALVRRRSARHRRDHRRRRHPADQRPLRGAVGSHARGLVADSHAAVVRRPRRALPPPPDRCRVEELRIAPWRARRIANLTHVLSAEAAAYVDAQLAPVADSCGVARIERLVTEAAAMFDPADQAETEDEAQGAWGVRLDHYRARPGAGLPAGDHRRHPHPDPLPRPGRRVRQGRQCREARSADRRKDPRLAHHEQVHPPTGPRPGQDRRPSTSTTRPPGCGSSSSSATARVSTPTATGRRATATSTTLRPSSRWTTADHRARPGPTTSRLSVPKTPSGEDPPRLDLPAQPRRQLHLDRPLTVGATPSTSEGASPGTDRCPLRGHGRGTGCRTSGPDRSGAAAL